MKTNVIKITKIKEIVLKYLKNILTKDGPYSFVRYATA